MRRLAARTLWVLSATVLVAAVLAACGTSDRPGSSLAVTEPTNLPGGIVGSMPAGLPDHLGIGLAAGFGSAGLDGWVPQSKIPFDYVYQYLAGGIGTGSGWQTWYPDATFPLDYAETATKQKHIPVLSYYMLLQSDGPCGSCVEPEKDLSHLNDPKLMAAYYEDFATLMKRLGTGTWNGIKGFGGVVIVHVEPDLSAHAEEAVLHSQYCYGHCSGVGNDPALLDASVSDTGIPQLSGLPNNYLGFNLALLHLRDLYAPNVLLGYHLSTWATGTDVASSTSSHLDAAALGAETGQFAVESGVGPMTKYHTSSYNLVFTDVADRDAQHSGIWWDVTNRRFPNFARWETFIGSAAKVFKRPVFLWQVPLGNEYFRTENGSTGHSRDDRIEYFFTHPSQLIDAGIAAVLYGVGNTGSSSNYDVEHDGVTNPKAVCDDHSGQEQCSTHVSHVADDDGGYLRMEATAYYQKPLPLNFVSG